MACHFIQVRSHGINISEVSLLPSFFAWAGQHGVLSKLGRAFLLGPGSTAFFPSSAHCSSRSSRTCSFPNPTAGIAVGSEVLVWSPVAVCLETEGSIRLLLNSWTPLAQICRSRNRESHAASEQSFILMIHRSLAGVNRVEARDEWS